jgi:phage shock protein E
MTRYPARSWSRLIAATAIAVMAVTGISACSSSAPASTSSPAASSGSPAAGAHLSASDFSTAMKAPGTVVLDVRTPAEFASGHLPQAQNFDIEGADFAAKIAALDKSATYAVYCHSGNRSGVALEQMAAAHFTHVYDLAGGIGAWQTMGGPMSMGGQ